ncbi:DUF2079 domain-containing protein, partial [Bacteroidota bacterium]
MFKSIGWIVVTATIVLFLFSSLRHELFQSTLLDLGFFDQALYLLSTGQNPIVSFVGYHILGDHAAFIFYPIALFYVIAPSVYWLFVIQALVLALGAVPVWCLAINAGLKPSLAKILSVVYLLYPLVFNINLFDFHTEVIAVPLLLYAVLFARQNKFTWFCFTILLIMACKEVLTLTVIFLGIWFLLEKKYKFGSAAIVAGICGFVLSTQIIIPMFTEMGVRALTRYDYLGNSMLEVLRNGIQNPGLILDHLITLRNLKYILLLIVLLAWGLHPSCLIPLIGAVPTVLLNLLTEYTPQKDLIHQYSLPALPFLVLALILALASGRNWLK